MTAVCCCCAADGATMEVGCIWFEAGTVVCTCEGIVVWVSAVGAGVGIWVVTGVGAPGYASYVFCPMANPKSDIPMHKAHRASNAFRCLYINMLPPTSYIYFLYIFHAFIYRLCDGVCLGAPQKVERCPLSIHWLFYIYIYIEHNWSQFTLPEKWKKRAIRCFRWKTKKPNVSGIIHLPQIFSF